MSDTHCFCGREWDHPRIAALEAENAELRRERDTLIMILGCVTTWVERLPEGLGKAVEEGKALAAPSPDAKEA